MTSAAKGTCYEFKQAGCRESKPLIEEHFARPKDQANLELLILGVESFSRILGLFPIAQNRSKAPFASCTHPFPLNLKQPIAGFTSAQVALQLCMHVDGRWYFTKMAPQRSSASQLFLASSASHAELITASTATSNHNVG